MILRFLSTVMCIALLVTAGGAQVPVSPGDTDCSGFVDLGDLTRLIDYLFISFDPVCDFVGPGVGFDQSNDTLTVTSSSWNYWLNFNMSTPADGWVVLQFSCSVEGVDSHQNTVALGQSLVGVAEPAAPQIVNQGWIEDGVLSLTHVLPVGQGIYNFSGNVHGDGGGTTAKFWNGRLVATYFPVNYAPAP